MVLLKGEKNSLIIKDANAVSFIIGQHLIALFSKNIRGSIANLNLFYLSHLRGTNNQGEQTHWRKI